MNKEIAQHNAVVLLSIIPKSFAVYGTALGFVREGGIISHDQDTDIGIFSDDFSWDFISRAIHMMGFEIVSIYGMRHHGLEVSLRREGVKTDIMVFYREGNKVWNSLWDNGCRHGLADEIRHEYSDRAFKTKTIKLNNGVNVASLGEEYLEEVYGKDWRVPVREWDWRTSHKCIKKI